MENLCRLCGKEYEFMLCVFDEFCEDLRIHSKIMKVLHIKVDADDTLPKKICAYCHQRLDSVLTFINCCHDTQRRFGKLCGAEKSANENLSTVEYTKHIDHSSNYSILSSSLLLPNSTTNETYPLQGDAGAELHRLPLHVDHKEHIHENESSPLINAKEQAILHVIYAKNDSNAEGNVAPENNASNESMMNEIRGNDLLNSEHDTENELGKKLRTYCESSAITLKTSNRMKIARIGKKISVKKKRRKISSTRGDVDYLAGEEFVRGKKEWVCDTCQMTFVQESLYTEHLNVHSGNRPYGCRLCSNSYRKRQELNQHIRKVHSEKRYKCTTCNYVAKHRGKLTEHKKSANEKPLICDQCTYRTGEKGKIHQHIANKHNGDLSYVCEICGFGFRTHPSLQAHRMNVHFPEPKICQKCGIVCPLANCSAHVCRGGKEKERYAYDKCDKTHINKEVLKDHASKHLHIKPFAFDICGKESHQRNTLDAHKFVPREAVYQCEVCSQSFNRKHNLKNHKKKHLYEPVKYDDIIVPAV